MHYIISIVGTTASGKTSLALEFSESFLSDNRKVSFQLSQILPKELLKHTYSGIDLISADSRQIYKELQIITGADVPDEFEQVTEADFQYPVHKSKRANIRLHGVGIIEKSAEWSVSHFKNFAIPIITKSWHEGRLPIVVGGTGLYHQQLFSTDPHLYVPPDQKIRQKADELSVIELQEWLKTVDSQKLQDMNNSDRNNPRRLIRAIEITLGEPQFSKVIHLPEDQEFQVIKLGLRLQLSELEEKITQRVSQRIFEGAIGEAEKLFKFCQSEDHPICGTLGLSDIFKHLEGKISQEQCIADWSLHEYQYAKRQLTWFQKNPDIIWLDSIKKTQYTEE